MGGGSNAAGAYYHFLDDKNVNIIAVEAAGLGVDSGESAATSALGKIGIIHGSKTLLMQSPDGQITEPYSISAGLDYPGVGPMHAHLFETGRAGFMSATDQKALNAAFELSAKARIIKVRVFTSTADSVARTSAENGFSFPSIKKLIFEPFTI